MPHIIPSLAIGSLGPTELVVIGIIGVLIFGRRLPEVGRNLGKSFVEFKRGLSGVDEEVKKTAAEAKRVNHQDQPRYDKSDAPVSTDAPAGDAPA